MELRNKKTEIPPTVNINNLPNADLRKMITNVTFHTTLHGFNKEVWPNFVPREACWLDATLKKVTANGLIVNLPAGYQLRARKWDEMQERMLV